MEVLSVTSYGWRDNFQTVEKKTIFDYPQGNDVTVVERRSYEVTLYSSDGSLNSSMSKENNLDQLI